MSDLQEIASSAAMLTKFVVCLLATCGMVQGMSSGPPDNADIVCNDITPDPSPHGSPTAGNGGFVVATDLSLSGGFYNYVQGDTYVGEPILKIRA